MLDHTPPKVLSYQVMEYGAGAQIEDKSLSIFNAPKLRHPAI